MATPKEHYTPFVNFNKYGSRSKRIQSKLRRLQTRHASQSTPSDTEGKESTVSLSLYRPTGAFQQDPFGSLPEDPIIPGIGNLLDFCHSIWCRSRPAAQTANTFLPAFIKESVQKESLFEALTAYAQAYNESILRRRSQPSTSLVLRLNGLVQNIQRDILDPNPEKIDELVLLIYMLIAICVGAGAHELRPHFAGMRRLINVRGGLDNLGLNGVAQGVVIVLHFFGLFTTSTSSSIPSPQHVNIPTMLPTLTISYPSHPFPPTLCTRIASLPDGCCSLALSGYLSTQTISILSSFQSWLKAPSSVKNDSRLIRSMYLTHGLLNLFIKGSKKQEGAVLAGRSPRLLGTETTISIALLLLSAEIFYGPQIHSVARQLSTRLQRIADTNFWPPSCTVNKKERTLVEKCKAWAFMIAAEACWARGPVTDNSAACMRRIFELDFVQRWQQDYADAEDAEDAEDAATTVWELFREQVLQQFLYPTFLLGEWKRCWIRHWPGGTEQPETKE